MLANTTVTATSKAIGISEATIYRYLSNDDFKQEYAERRRQMLEDNCHTLQSNMNKAITELVEIIDDKTISSQVRLNAIDMLLRHTYKQTEMVDIITRIDALEEVYGK